jgi:hypothetical protein
MKPARFERRSSYARAQGSPRLEVGIAGDDRDRRRVVGASLLFTAD